MIWDCALILPVSIIALMSVNLFEANIRRDGSSRFAKRNQWGTFPSFSVGWLISEEKFYEKLGLAGYVQNQSIMG